MKNINKNLISYIFPVLFLVSIFGFAVIPTKVSAQMPYTNYNGYIDLRKSAETDSAPSYNPTPTIVSVNPSSSNIGVGTKTVNIIGGGFVPSSVARINGAANRGTTFIDSSHLLMQVTGNDTYLYSTNGGFYITVFNRLPGGGYSNAAFFTIKDDGESVAGTTNDTSTNFTDTGAGSGSVNDTNESNLASNVIFGSNSFLPSGLIQWIFFAIIILVIVILVRRVYEGNKKYQATPLKHD